MEDLAPAAIAAPTVEPASPRVAVADRREANARTDVRRFLPLAAQLLFLTFVFYLFPQGEAGSFRVRALCVAAFFVHYWLPFRLKEVGWIAASAAGAVLLVGAWVAGLVFGVGLLIYALLSSPLPFRWRLGILLAFSAVLAYGRAKVAWGVPVAFWPVFGALFMFRLMIYVYDLSHSRERPGLKEYCTYFFPMQNFHFLLFPVVDFQTLRRGYYGRDIHVVAQQGIVWIVRGTVQLALYRIIYQLKPPFAADSVTSFPQLVMGMFLIYLLYLRVSGEFHVIAGLFHLFGYDLPETHRKYLLARSIMDLWRRINIYWKDFMVKIVYFPVYFRLRKRGDTRAQLLATGAVFLVTWFLHAYQWFWLRGDLLFSWPDTAFWAILGGLVVVNLLLEQRARRRPPRGPRPWLHVLQVAGTLCLIMALWSMWSTPSLGEWWDVVTWWRIG